MEDPFDLQEIREKMRSAMRAWLKGKDHGNQIRLDNSGPIDPCGIPEVSMIRVKIRKVMIAWDMDRIERNPINGLRENSLTGELETDQIVRMMEIQLPMRRQ